MINFPQLEKKILSFWKKNKIFQKSIKARPKSRQFVFYEGPPTANGKPGLHHVLARAYKDVICRYKTMQGFRVERKAGWDTHGLPVELEAEKELGLKSKKDIEKYGIAQFNKKCKVSVWKYKKLWEDLTERIGFWLALENPYITYSPDYIETVWYIIKRIWQKGLFYQGFKVVPYCYRCGTSLSSHEVAQGYKKIREQAVYVKFNLKSQISNLKKIYLLSWTTTPWTLPGNVALAVHPDLIYVLVRVGKEQFILAKSRLEILDKNYKIIKEFKGKTLVGLGYEPLFDIKELQNDVSHKVYAADFVTADEGTGIVHTAMMYGVDDYALGKKHGLPRKHTVDEQGRFNNLVQGFEGKAVKAGQTEKALVDYLKKKKLLFKDGLYEHDYPFCWRCKEPSLYYAKKTWFIKMTKVKKQLIENNKKINWVPGHLRDGRFGEWLREVKDWALSRERYWGTPLPVWRCLQCNEMKVIGSIKELEKLSGRKINDPHRPGIDKITFRCDKCEGVMERAPEVIDCWFDSGAMPFAQNHWPFDQKKHQKELSSFSQKRSLAPLEPPELFPADYISEAIDQTRGWFYTLLAISTLLGFGPSYKNVISLGHLLDEKGEKMSKSRGNVIDPWLVINKYGADATRWYFFTVNQPGDSKRVGLKDIETTLKKFLMTLWNCYVFLETYLSKEMSNVKSQNLLDKWIISRLNVLIQVVTDSLDNYDITSAARAIEDFVINDLSLWYIRRSRKRFQHPETGKALEGASAVLGHILLTVSKLTAPFAPFLSEEIYQKSKDSNMPKSIHLSDWPKANKGLIDVGLNRKMERVRELATLALAERAKKGIKVRQPLNVLKIGSRLNVELREVLKSEINVKRIEYRKELKDMVKLDTKITAGLKEEGIVREVIRQIQEMRKKLGLTPKDKIGIYYQAKEKLNNILTKNRNSILKEARAENLESGKKVVDVGNKIELDREELWLGLKKI